MESVINLHISCLQYPDSRIVMLGHCQMVSWLIENFRKIKNLEVTYKDYESFGNSKGVRIFSEESFTVFQNQKYI